MSNQNVVLESIDNKQLREAMNMFSAEFKKTSRADINKLPDSAFAIILPGGKKDKGGKTQPRSLRKFPIHDKTHVRNALARLPQSDLTAAQKAQALKKILAAAKKFGIEVDKKKTKQSVPSDTNDQGRMSMPTNGETKTTSTDATDNANVTASTEASKADAKLSGGADLAVVASQQKEIAELTSKVVALSEERDGLANKFESVNKELEAKLEAEKKARADAEFSVAMEKLSAVATKDQIAVFKKYYDTGILNAAVKVDEKEQTVLSFGIDLLIAGSKHTGEAEDIKATESSTSHNAPSIANVVERKLQGYAAGLRRRGKSANELEALVVAKKAELIGADQFVQ